MTTFTETAHSAEFILSEANGSRSRDTGVVASGRSLPAGQVVQLSAGKYIAYTGTLNTAGTLITAAAGVLLSAVDATSADTACVVITRDAEVNKNLLTYGALEATMIATLKLLGIIAR